MATSDNGTICSGRTCELRKLKEWPKGIYPLTNTAQDMVPERDHPEITGSFRWVNTTKDLETKGSGIKKYI